MLSVWRGETSAFKGWMFPQGLYSGQKISEQEAFPADNGRRKSFMEAMHPHSAEDFARINTEHIASCGIHLLCSPLLRIDYQSST